MNQSQSGLNLLSPLLDLLCNASVKATTSGILCYLFYFILFYIIYLFILDNEGEQRLFISTNSLCSWAWTNAVWPWNAAEGYFLSFISIFFISCGFLVFVFLILEI